MKNIFIITLLASIFTLTSNAGCMKDKVEQINAKLENSNISETNRSKASELRDLVLKNEHSDREAAESFYLAALDLLK